MMIQSNERIEQGGGRFTLRRPASATSCLRELGLTWADAIDNQAENVPKDFNFNPFC